MSKEIGENIIINNNPENGDALISAVLGKIILEEKTRIESMIEASFQYKYYAKKFIALNDRLKDIEYALGESSNHEMDGLLRQEDIDARRELLDQVKEIEKEIKSILYEAKKDGVSLGSIHEFLDEQAKSNEKIEKLRQAFSPKNARNN